MPTIGHVVNIGSNVADPTAAAYGALDAALQAAGFQVLASNASEGWTEYASAGWDVNNPQDDEPHFYLDKTLGLSALHGGINNAQVTTVYSSDLSNGDVYIAADGQRGWFWVFQGESIGNTKMLGVSKLRRYPTDVYQGTSSKFAIFDCSNPYLGWIKTHYGDVEDNVYCEFSGPLQCLSVENANTQNIYKNIVAPMFLHVYSYYSYITSVLGEVEDFMLTGQGHEILEEVISGWLFAPNCADIPILVRKPPAFDRQPDII